MISFVNSILDVSSVGPARAGAQVEVNYVRQNVSNNIFMDDVRCTGTENRLADCPRANWNVTDCGINEIISISCVQLDQSAPDREFVFFIQWLLHFTL